MNSTIRREIEADQTCVTSVPTPDDQLQRFLSNSPAVVLGSNRRSLWLLGTTALGWPRSSRNMELRAQRDARAMGLDERPRGPFDHLRVGYGVRVTAPGSIPTITFITKYTNVLGMDDDVGYKVLRVTMTANRGHHGGYFQLISNRARLHLRMGYRSNDIGLVRSSTVKSRRTWVFRS